MRGNKFGKLFSFVTFGESHGEALGVVIDGVTAGLDFNLEDLQIELDRRAPGRVAGTTNRKEADSAEVLSGVFQNKTLGTPIAVIVRNTNQRSKDYDKLKSEYRPGHADETTQGKYGFRDHRGGGRSSGRETLARVIAGYFASLMIPKIEVRAYISKMGPFSATVDDLLNTKDISPYNYPLVEKNTEIKKYLLKLKADGESVGGRISILIKGTPIGLGEPAFDKLKADFAKSLLSIGACVSFSFGLGEEMANLMGSEVSSKRENFGGIEGGISNGEDIFMTTTFKPTSTIGEKAKEGRHDPCILPRAVPVVEAMVKCVLADHFLRQRAYGDGGINE
ncbi:chorismate synthase [Halobacteriovorax sp. JY17]|uniref:chorismate synthase n=1 Tax=Halobacteriovorax sp. JY17 TaxID=2014617 RepID=UPI000C6AA537|nr:chorismate synthase [Halobacteriovorax sp. JY17]PIK14046.1 MAG: chorismate synthase [Halobacteriovorax sp. JY17]